MSIVRRGSRVQVPNASGREVYAGVDADTKVERLAGRRRRALNPLRVFKRDHPEGGSVTWTLPIGTEFTYVSAPTKKK